MQVTHVAPGDASASIGRRRLLGLGLGIGAGASLLPLLSAGTAGAAAATPPKGPTADDIELLAAANRLEITLREVYDDAISGVSGWTDQQAAVMVAMREAHEEFANALSGALGSDAPGERSEVVYAQLRNAAKGSPADVIVAMWGVESAAVATHLAVLGQLEGTNGAALTASIQVAEARHCTILADLAGITDRSLLLVDQEAAAIEVKE